MNHTYRLWRALVGIYWDYYCPGLFYGKWDVYPRYYVGYTVKKLTIYIGFIR